MDRSTGIDHALMVLLGGAVDGAVGGAVDDDVDNDVGIAADDDLEGSQRRSQPRRQSFH
jgi:hypothetical protein